VRIDTPVRVELLESDKDGTLEKRWFKKEGRNVRGDDGTERVEIVEPWEVHATGKKCYELKGAFKDSGPQMTHEKLTEIKKIGETTITRPDGSLFTVRADKEHLFRDQPGYCQRAVRPTMVCNVPWKGSMKLRGLRYHKSIIRNGELVTVEER
jgi:hypothetical protein